MAQAPAATAAPAASSTANPAPLGLAGFALALAYGGLAQLLAGMWEFKSGNTFGATAFTSYGAFWLSDAAFVWFFAANLKSGDAAGAVGTYLLVWGIFTFYMWIATLKHARPVMIVFLLLWITFLVLAVGEFQANKSITQIGGYLGILTAIAAWHASARTIINEAWGREILPG